MRTFITSLVLFASSALSHANSPSPTPSQTTPEIAAQMVTYYEPVSTVPPLEGFIPKGHLELRQARAAAQPAAAQPAAVQPVAGAGAGAGAGAAQPAAVQPVAVAAQPAAVQPVAGAAPAVGVGGAGAVPAAAQPASTNPGQVSPVTTVQVFSVIGGVTQQVPFVFTQKFSSFPSQGPTPAKGEIGMGTLTGKIGVVNTAAAKKGGASRTMAIGFGGMTVMTMGILAMLAI